MAPKTPIYLDNAATTRTDPRVVEAMLPCFTEIYGNPGSRNHQFGWAAEDAIKAARAQVAALVGQTEQLAARGQVRGGVVADLDDDDRCVDPDPAVPDPAVSHTR